MADPPERLLSACDDDELMLLSRAGKQAAFAELVRRHAPALRSYCARSCGSLVGDDIAQEVFVAVYRTRDQYLPGGRFRTFLFTIAARRCKNVHRDARTRREKLAQAAPEQDSGRSSLDALLAEERRRRLHELLAALPEAQRTAIHMRFSAGLAYAELAEAVGCSEPTARTRVHLGLSKLRKLWTKRGEP